MHKSLNRAKDFSCGNEKDLPEIEALKRAKDRVLACFGAGEFEEAVKLLNSSGARIEIPDLKGILVDYEKAAAEALLRDDFEEVRKLRHRTESLQAFCTGGFNPNTLIPKVLMTEAYCGKILLVSISGGVIDEMICLRSNDLHHRDILRNAELALRDIGLHGSRARELGGAYVSNEIDGHTCIRGGSDEFGACDKNLAAVLIMSMYPNKTIFIQDSR